ncbi:MAG TPA: rhodanese-like domain-containing protein [Gemmatimonadaceae bacterium]|jgi:rhodanese-related sulfurtransferase
MPTYKTGQHLLDEARARVKEISARDAVKLRASRPDVVFLDIREQPEVNLGTIPGAVHLARGSLETNIEALVPREKRVVVYCANGNRSAFAADTLQQMGYGEVESMAGGFRDWIAADGDVES